MVYNDGFWVIAILILSLDLENPLPMLRKDF